MRTPFLISLFSLSVFWFQPVCASTPAAEIIYFLLIDRFCDGDSSNNRGYNPSSYEPYDGSNPIALKSYQGGDLRGVIQKLGYLQNLGVTALWLSPFLDNSNTDYVGWQPYHGYHPIDFYRVDEHFGTLYDLQELVRQAHSRGIKVIFDMPFNQTAAEHPWLADSTKKSWFHFDENGNPNEITDWFDQNQIEIGELHGLPDLAQENPAVYDYLLLVSKYWIDQTGCDGFRLDAVKHIPIDFWRKFNQDIKNFAGSDFMLIGEVFWGETERILPYKDLDFTQLFDIPGYYVIRNVFAQGASARYLSDYAHSSASLWREITPVTLIDNHDVARFNYGISKNSWEKQRLALSYLLTMPGIPMLYYGAEIGMPGYTPVDPVSGEPQDYLNRLPFPPLDETSRQKSEQIAALLNLRKLCPALYEGDFYETYVDWGIYGFIRQDSAESFLVFINTSDKTEKFSTDMNGWEIASRADLLYGDGKIKGSGKIWNLTLPPLSLTVWKIHIQTPHPLLRQAPFTDRLTGDYKIITITYADNDRAEKVQIAGDFNNWQPTDYPGRGENDHRIISVPLRPGKYRYKFVLDGNRWEADPNAPFELDPWGGNNSILVVE